jgi:hypothetical protein
LKCPLIIASQIIIFALCPLRRPRMACLFNHNRGEEDERTGNDALSCSSTALRCAELTSGPVSGLVSGKNKIA